MAASNTIKKNKYLSNNSSHQQINISNIYQPLMNIYQIYTRQSWIYIKYLPDINTYLLNDFQNIPVINTSGINMHGDSQSFSSNIYQIFIKYFSVINTSGINMYGGGDKQPANIYYSSLSSGKPGFILKVYQKIFYWFVLSKKSQ